MHERCQGASVDGADARKAALRSFDASFLQAANS